MGQLRGSEVLAAGGGVLDTRGPVAETIADLWWLMLGLGIVVFLVFLVLLVAGLRREVPDHTAEPVREDRLVPRWIGAGGVVMPTVVIVVVFVATLGAMSATSNEVPQDALDVEVTAHQFWYEVRYSDTGLVTANELHIPTGRPIALRLWSADVIHSFWVPELGGKLDMLPERVNTLVLTADEPGEYRSRCAEFCGLSHANMTLMVVAEDPDSFASWMTDQLDVTAPSGEQADRGRDVFVNAACVDCHAPVGERASDTDGPDLTTFAERSMIGAGVLPNTPDNVAEWIRDPTELKPGVEMPATALTDDEVESLLAYLGVGR